MTISIDPANLSLLNDRLTQLRLRKERLEEELHAANQPVTGNDGQALRKWARDSLAGLQAAMVGTRNDRARAAISVFVDHITVWPSQKSGEMVLNAASQPLWKNRILPKHNDRPEGRSRGNKVGATRFELATSWTQTRRSSQAELRPERRDYSTCLQDRNEARSAPAPGMVSDLIFWRALFVV